MPIKIQPLLCWRFENEETLEAGLFRTVLGDRQKLLTSLLWKMKICQPPQRVAQSNNLSLRKSFDLRSKLFTNFSATLEQLYKNLYTLANRQNDQPNQDWALRRTLKKSFHIRLLIWTYLTFDMNLFESLTAVHQRSWNWVLIWEWNALTITK